MKKIIVTFLFLLVAPYAFAITGDEVISLVDTHEDGYIDLTANVEIILKDGSGKHSIRYMKLFSIESEGIGEKRKFVFTKPGDIKGTAILIHSMVTTDDKQWIYLPAFKRVKRISAKNRKTAFVGSQFSYEDLASQEKEKYKNEFLREDSVNGIPCYVVKRTPSLPGSGYSYIIAYIDKKRHRYIKVDYYDYKKNHFKTMYLSDYQLYKNRFLLPSTYTINNHQTKETTVMKWDDIVLQTGLSQSDFTKNALKRTR